MRYSEYIELCTRVGARVGSTGVGTVAGLTLAVPAGVVGGMAGFVFSPIACIAGAAFSTDSGNTSTGNVLGGAVFGFVAAPVMTGYHAATTVQPYGDAVGRPVGTGFGGALGAVVAILGTPIFAPIRWAELARERRERRASQRPTELMLRAAPPHNLFIMMVWCQLLIHLPQTEFNSVRHQTP